MFQNVNMQSLNDAIGVMWQGMLGIFVVMAIIAFVVYLFTKFSK